MVRPFALPDLPVLTGSEAAAFDALSIRERGVPAPVLMERAGSAAAALLNQLVPQGPVLVLAGKGHNGGDALVVARCLVSWGRQVRILGVGRSGAEDPLLHGWPVRFEASQSLDDASLRALLTVAFAGEGAIVDGVLGTGLAGPPTGEPGRVLSLLEAVRASASTRALILSLDVPSGVVADTGDVPGSSAPADVTLSFGWPKLGTLLHPGRGRAGRLVTVEIGFPPLPYGFAGARLLSPAWARVHRPRRDPVTHKNRVGAVSVVAGRPGMAGAAVLAGRAALRAGAGYVRIVSHGANRDVVQSALPEAVFVDAGDPAAVAEALAASRAVAVGPAMGTDPGARAVLDQVLATEVPRVVDADALTLLAASGVSALGAGGTGTIVTPHPGEAARLLGGPVGEAPGDRLSALRALRERTGATVLLKGTPSLVLGAGGLWVDSVGTSDLAVAGMGDALTGTIAAFLAQGVAMDVAAGLGLVATGRAASRASRGTGLQAADIPEHLPDALREEDGVTDLRLPGILLDLDAAR